jgi:hypothetical protein
MKSPWSQQQQTPKEAQVKGAKPSRTLAKAQRDGSMIDRVMNILGYRAKQQRVA